MGFITAAVRLEEESGCCPVFPGSDGYGIGNAFPCRPGDLQRPVQQDDGGMRILPHPAAERKGTVALPFCS
jgi:hypothetical protein